MVESIANGDSHVPFRDSKLTMLLQVTFLPSVKFLRLRILCSCSDCVYNGDSLFLLSFAQIVTERLIWFDPILLFRILLRMINPKF